MQWGEETGKETDAATDSEEAVSASETTAGAAANSEGTATSGASASSARAAAPGFLTQFLNDFEHRNPFRRGERNDLALKLGRVSRSKGFSKKELEEVISLFIRRYAATDFTAEDIRQRITAGYQFIDSLPQKTEIPARVQIGFISLMTPPSRPMRAPKKKICWKKTTNFVPSLPTFPTAHTAVCPNS